VMQPTGHSPGQKPGAVNNNKNYLASSNAGQDTDSPIACWKGLVAAFAPWSGGAG